MRIKGTYLYDREYSGTRAILKGMLQLEYIVKSCKFVNNRYSYRLESKLRCGTVRMILGWVFHKWIRKVGEYQEKPKKSRVEGIKSWK